VRRVSRLRSGNIECWRESRAQCGELIFNNIHLVWSHGAAIITVIFQTTPRSRNTSPNDPKSHRTRRHLNKINKFASAGRFCLFMRPKGPRENSKTGGRRKQRRKIFARLIYREELKKNITTSGLQVVVHVGSVRHDREQNF
jgi:hypothetical protein